MVHYLCIYHAAALAFSCVPTLRVYINLCHHHLKIPPRREQPIRLGFIAASSTALFLATWAGDGDCYDTKRGLLRRLVVVIVWCIIVLLLVVRVVIVVLLAVCVVIAVLLAVCVVIAVLLAVCVVVEEVVPPVAQRLT